MTYQLKPGAWVHFVAIGGTGMGALASLLKDLGYKVTGSDGKLYPPMSTFLDSKKIVRGEEFRAEHLEGKTWGPEFPENPHLVIVGNAISRGHVEAEKVEKLLAESKTERMSFAQALAEFCIQDKTSLVVAGTHGKTTTTSILASFLESLKKAPGFFVGGIPLNFSQGSRVTGGKVFVSEGDEYDTAYWDKESKFLHYRPTWVLCTGIEFDHADIYANIEAIEKSFLKLISKTKKGWVLIDAETAPRADSIQKIEAELKRLNKPVVTYGESATASYRLLEAKAKRIPWIQDRVAMGTELLVQFPDGRKETLLSPMCGRHNAWNAVGVIATIEQEYGSLKKDELQRCLQEFLGVKRRQEEVFVSPRLVVIDDFAHHPTAIRETLRAIRARYPDASITAFFEPRSATSARNVLQKEFSECFQSADHVFLSYPTKTNIPADLKLNVDDLKVAIEKNKGQTHFVSLGLEAEDLSQSFGKWFQEESSKKPCVALVMSNGSFGGLHQKLSTWVK